MKSDRRPPPGVDPALVPFIDALAELLVAQELRLAESRRVLRDIAAAPRSPPRATKRSTK